MSWTTRALTILGSTGSIGVNTLSVAAELKIPVYALTAHSQVEKLAEQARACKATVAVIADDHYYNDLKQALSGSGIEARAGAEALNEVSSSPEADAVVTAIVGGAGLAPTLTAIRAGKRVCIANKEPLVMAGELIMNEARKSGAVVLPIDSEHSALFQCLEGHSTSEVEKLIITGSGGPFRTLTDLSQVTLEQALKHPNWSMGQKITIDSASLMNKSLEIIEARWLFNIELDRIDLLIHPQSIVHSMVSYRDGSVLAQLGKPDMRTPIQYALTYPVHTTGSMEAPDFTQLAHLDFEEPKHDIFPSVRMGYDAARRGGLAPVIMNAANETAVDHLLKGRCSFIDIFAYIEHALTHIDNSEHPSLDAILDADRYTRRYFENGIPK